MIPEYKGGSFVKMKSHNTFASSAVQFSGTCLRRGQARPVLGEPCAAHTWNGVPTWGECRGRPLRASSRLTCNASLTGALTKFPGQTAVQSIFAVSTLYHIIVMAVMIIAPRWQKTRDMARSDYLLFPLGLAYAFLLLHSWEPDTFSLILPGSLKEGLSGGFKPQFMPSIHGIGVLFSRFITAASLWLHLLAINLFAARTILLEGLQELIPVRHSLLLTALFGPLGLLCHYITQAIVRARRR